MAALALLRAGPRSPGPVRRHLLRGRGSGGGLRATALILGLVLLGSPAAARAEISFIPLPAFDTDPNAGETYGVLPVLLFRDRTNQVRSILAPSVTYNEVRGLSGTFRYFDYPGPLERLDVVAGYSQNIERKLDLHYRNLGLFAGRFHADVQFLHDRDASVRFFGLGSESRQENETNMTLEVTGLYAIFGLNVTPHTRLSLGETFQRFNVLRGGIPGLPFTEDVFPSLPGINGATVHAQRAALIYDDRDSLTTPTRGLFVNLFTEASSELLGSDADYIKSGVEVTYLRPLTQRIVFVAHGLLEIVSGDSDTPFEVLPTLGGFTTLRGFSPNRFFGDARFVLNLETRIRVLKLPIFGITAEFEVAPFVDVGKVFNSIDQFLSAPFEITPGIGFRGLTPPSVVGHIDIGVGREGVAIYVGLDYPF